MQMSLYYLTAQRDNMSAAKYDLTIDQGSDFKITLNVKENGVNKDLTGWSARGQLRETLEADVAEDFNFGSSPYDATGNIVATISNEDAGNLTAGQYFYDIEIFTQKSNVVGYYDTGGQFNEYTAQELADVTRFAIKVGVSSDTIPADRQFLLDINGDGKVSAADALSFLLQSATRDQAFQDAYNATYASNETSYGTTIVDTLKTGDVAAQGTESSTRILQGKVNVTRQVTR